MIKRDVWILLEIKGPTPGMVAVIGTMGNDGMRLASILARQRFAYTSGRTLDAVPEKLFDRAWRKVAGTGNDWVAYPMDKSYRMNGHHFILTTIKEVS